MRAKLLGTAVGAAGLATEVTMSRPRGRRERVQVASAVGVWFLHCPGQSPAWDRYLLSVIHLRPVKGAPPAHLAFPGASHEVVLFALDPRGNPRPEMPASWEPLTPWNVSEQVELPDDEAARVLGAKAATAVVHGMLPAEPALSGAREPWRTSMIRTSAHLRGEEHAP